MDYVAMQRGSEASVGGGAATTASREFLFPAVGAADFIPGVGTGVMKFAGDVQFTA